MKTTKHLIDWGAYKQGLAQLNSMNHSAQPPSADIGNRARDHPPADEGTAELQKLADRQQKVAETLALGNVGQHLGDWQGRGLAPVKDDDGTKMVFDAMAHHDQLQRLLGERLHQNYSQRLKLGADADQQKTDNELKMGLQQLKGEQELQRLQHRQLFDAAVQTMVDDPKPPTAPKTPEKTTVVRRTQGSRGKSADKPFVIADTDGRQVFGHWNLTTDEAAQVLQTAIDLGDQAQLDYVSRLVGTDAGADRRTTTARLMALQQKALMGNADARQRMVQLLSAIIPSLKGRNVIDGILRPKYQKSPHTVRPSHK